MIEFHDACRSCAIARRVVLQPDPVELEVRVGTPAEPFERRAARMLRERAAGPRAAWKALAKMTDLDAIQPDRMLSVRLGDWIVELDHVLDTGPSIRVRLHVRVVEQQISPVVAVDGSPHVSPIVVMIESRGLRVLLCGCNEPIVAGRLHSRARVRPGKGRIVPAHPDTRVRVSSAAWVLDVVTDI